MRAAAKAACQRSKSGHPKSELLVAIPTVAPLRLTMRHRQSDRALWKRRERSRRALARGDGRPRDGRPRDDEQARRRERADDRP